METYISWLITMDFPARLIQLRKHKGLTQQAMAEAIGINVTQVKRYESGASQPSLEALRKIALTLGVTTDSLLFGEAERDPTQDLRLQFEAVSRFDEEDKRIAKALLEGLILKHEAKRWMQAAAPTSVKTHPAARATKAGTSAKRSARRRTSARAGA